MSEKKVTFTINAEATLTPPLGVEEERAEDGTLIGFKLPDGAEISPSIVWEKTTWDAERKHGEGTELSFDESLELGLEVTFMKVDFETPPVS